MCDKSTNPLSGFSDAELEAYNTERYSMYRGTISVCVIYASIALILILLGYFTQWGHDFILGTILWFTITYIIGTILIIIYLGYLVTDYKPHKTDTRVNYSNDICPDYWKLVISNDTEYKDGAITSNVNQNLFKYKCVPDDKIFNTNAIKLGNANKYNLDSSKNLFVDLSLGQNSSAPGLINDKRDQFNTYSLYMDGYEINTAHAESTNDDPGKYSVTALTSDSTQLASITDNTTSINTADASGKRKIPLQCDKVYPLFLASMDKQNAALNSNDPKNVFRCAYSKACGMPWTEAGCAAD